MSDGDQEFPVQEQEYPGTTDAMTLRPADEIWVTTSDVVCSRAGGARDRR